MKTLLLSTVALGMALSVNVQAQSFDPAKAMLCLGRSTGDRYLIAKIPGGFKLYSPKGTSVITEASAKQQKCFINKTTSAQGMRGGSGLLFNDPQGRKGEPMAVFFAGARDDGGISQWVSEWQKEGIKPEDASTPCKWSVPEMPTQADMAFMRSEISKTIRYTQQNYVEWRKNFKADDDEEAVQLAESKLSRANWVIDKCSDVDASLAKEAAAAKLAINGAAKVPAGTARKTDFSK